MDVAYEALWGLHMQYHNLLRAIILKVNMYLLCQTEITFIA